MKFLVSQRAAFFRLSSERHLAVLITFFSLLLLAVIVYTILFQVLMHYEERHFSWITGLYWTLTVMSTLGFGDITFHSHLGRLFSVLVLLTGLSSLLIMLLFTFSRVLNAPWSEAQTKNKVARWLPKKTQGHIILTKYDAFERYLVSRLVTHHYSYAIVLEDVQKALEIFDLNYRVVVGELGNP